MVWTPFHTGLAVVYIAGLLLLGLLAGRQRGETQQYLSAAGGLPLWLCIAAAIAANCGSLDVIAMMALGAQYGMLACHFYWIGAIPALLVLTFWLLPSYARQRYPSVLDLLESHYGPQTRALVALGMATMMLLLAGVCLAATAQVATTFLGWGFWKGALITASVVLLYTVTGGLRATIFTQLLHFAFVLAAIVPLGYFVLRDFGGVHGLLSAIPPTRLYIWHQLPWLDPNAIMDRFGLVFGLGIVLSFGYWSTDFVVMQRALAVRRPEDIQYVPAALATAKLVFAMVVVVPGVAAPIVLRLPASANWNATLPSMVLRYYSPFWIVIGLIGLAASLIATFANNVAGFSAAWIQGVCQSSVHPSARGSRDLWMGRVTNTVAVVLSLGGAHVALTYHSFMEYMQLIFAAFNGPLLALVLLAAILPQRSVRGGLAGFSIGLLSAIAHQLLVRAGILHYGSPMSANFYAAALSFSVAVVVALVAARLNSPHALEAQTPPAPTHFSSEVRPPVVALALAILAAFVAFNAYFW